MVMGRPRKELDQHVFEELCKIQCTQEEVCNVVQMNHETLNERLKELYGGTFSQIYKQFADQGRSSLRRYQFKLAEKNAAMAIWLGKQYLGQTDKIEVTNEELVNTKLEILQEKPDKKRFAKYLN